MAKTCLKGCGCLGCEYPKRHPCGYQHPRTAITVHADTLIQRNNLKERVMRGGVQRKVGKQRVAKNILTHSARSFRVPRTDFDTPANPKGHRTVL